MLINIKAWVLLCVLFCVSPLSYALEVHPELGNVTYTAIDCLSKNSGKPLYVERFYNSASKQTGWFGFGHGSQFETYLKKEADGSLSVHEYGQTAARSFIPGNGEVQLDKMVDKILESKKFSSLGTSKEVLKKKLTENRNFRIETAKEIGLISSVSDGESFFSNDFDGEKIVYKDMLFTRTTRDGKIEIFNTGGKLTEVRFPRKKQNIFLSYDEKGLIKNISDNYGNRLLLSLDMEGKVLSLQNASDNKAATYQYRKNVLEKVINTKNETYHYEFDRNLNLRKVKRPQDQKPISIDYNQKDRLPLKVTFANGSKIEFAHKLQEEKGKTIRTVSQKKINSEGALEENLKWIYVHQVSPSGEKQLISRSFDDGIALSETTYRACCYPQPEKIVTGGQQVEFNYDTENRLKTKKYSNGRKLEISYDSRGLISQVIVNDVPYFFKHDPQTAELEEVTCADYKMKMDREQGLLRSVSYSMKPDGKIHVAKYSYDNKKRLTSISIDQKSLVKYSYSQNGEQEAQYVDQESSEKMLTDVDKMMLDSMVLREVNYTF